MPATMCRMGSRLDSIGSRREYKNSNLLNLLAVEIKTIVNGVFEPVEIYGPSEGQILYVQ